MTLAHGVCLPLPRWAAWELGRLSPARRQAAARRLHGQVSRPAREDNRREQSVLSHCQGAHGAGIGESRPSPPSPDRASGSIPAPLAIARENALAELTRGRSPWRRSKARSLASPVDPKASPRLRPQGVAASPRRSIANRPRLTPKIRPESQRLSFLCGIKGGYRQPLPRQPGKSELSVPPEALPCDRQKECCPIVPEEETRGGNM